MFCLLKPVRVSVRVSICACFLAYVNECTKSLFVFFYVAVCFDMYVYFEQIHVMKVINV